MMRNIFQCGLLLLVLVNLGYGLPAQVKPVPLNQPTDTQNPPATKAPTKNPVKPDGQISPTTPTTGPPSTATAVKPAPEAVDSLSLARQQRCIETIREAGEAAKQVKEEFRAALLQAKVADELWPYDKVVALKLFEDAYEAADKYVKASAAGQVNARDKTDTARQQDARMAVIRLLTRHSETSARPLLENYLADKKREEQRRRYGIKENDGWSRLLGAESQLANELLGAAESLLEINRPLALELARKAIEQLPSTRLPAFLYALAKVDRDAADALFLQALTQLRYGLPPPGALAVLGVYALGTNIMRINDGQSVYFYSYQPPPGYQPKPTVVGLYLQRTLNYLRQYAESNQVQRSLANSWISAGYFLGLTFQPAVAVLYPQLLEEWQILTGKLAALAKDEARQSIEAAVENNATLQNGRLRKGDDVPTLLNRAAQARDFVTRDTLYQEAAFVLLAEENFDEALNVAGKIGSLEFRRGVEAWIHFAASERARKQEKFDDAQKHAEAIPVLEQRAFLLFKTAAAAQQKGDPSLAGGLARAAATAAETASNSPTRVRVTLGAAFVFVELDVNRAFDLLGDAIKRIDALSENDRYEAEKYAMTRTLSLPKGEMSEEVDDRGMSLEVTLAQLAKHDLERASSMTRELADPAARTIALLALSKVMAKP